MKTILSTILVATLASTAVGCLPGASLDKGKLVKTASFDNGCPADKIQLVSEDDHGMDGTGQYLLSVCGTQKKYKRAGTIYYDAEKGGPMGH